MSHLLPGDGTWELRLSQDEALNGTYSIAIYDPKRWTQAGPFTLRFPTPEYALNWFESVTQEGTRKPEGDVLAREHLLTSFVSAQGSAAVWGPIVNALFHSDHSGPYLASPWWYGSVPPFVERNPLMPTPLVTDEDLAHMVQVFVGIEDHRMVALRKQTGTSESAVQFMWWQGGRFAPGEPQGMAEGRQFLIYQADAEYSDLLGLMLITGVMYPEPANMFFSIREAETVSRKDFEVAELTFAVDLVRQLTDRPMSMQIRDVRQRLHEWLVNDLSVDRNDLACWIAHCMVTAQRSQDPLAGLRAQDAPRSSSVDQPAAGDDDEEFDEFYEVLFGPEGSDIFALHHIHCWRKPGQSQWTVDEHEWRVAGEWTEEFPEELDDWRWAQEDRRLAAIPETVARIQADRGQEEEFVLAWDVSDSIRINDTYVKPLINLFDLFLPLPVGLAYWLETSPTQICDPKLMESASDPRFEVAVATLSSALKHHDDWPPDELVKPLRQFVEAGEPRTAGEIAGSIMGLLRWSAIGDGTVKLPEIIDSIDVDEIDIDGHDLTGTDRLVKFIAALAALTDDVVVVNVESDRYPDGVYVQLCREDDGALTLEAVSSRFLESPLTPDEVSVMESLGWEDPRDDDLPNYTRYLEPRATSPGEVAEFLVKTLHRVYGTKPSDLHQFAPEPLVRSLLKGEHGQEYAMNPNLSDAQKARLYLGLRFPGDLAPVIGR